MGDELEVQTGWQLQNPGVRVGGAPERAPRNWGPHAELPWVLRVVCHEFASVSSSCWSPVGFLDTDLLPSPLSLVTVALLPLIVLHFSFGVCIVG